MATLPKYVSSRLVNNECSDMVPNTALLGEIKVAGCNAPSIIQTAIHASYVVSRYLG